ncbi:UNVERIFIED_CONTAM: hypothetical protein Sradi_5753100 [Sesamum radiatum]|uniref:Uncharacterized protein n=1 Tax=Sesamum radiatum TaxID=300843 RepID=A0AAW2L694_SESRA
MELGIGSHPGPGIYAYYLRPCCAELLDIGTSYPIRAMIVATGSPSTTHLQAHRRYFCHVMTGDRSSSWNSLYSLHTPTALDKAYDDHISDTVTSRTYPRYSHRVHCKELKGPSREICATEAIIKNKNTTIKTN